MNYRYEYSKMSEKRKWIIEWMCIAILETGSGRVGDDEDGDGDEDETRMGTRRGWGRVEDKDGSRTGMRTHTELAHGGLELDAKSSPSHHDAVCASLRNQLSRREKTENVC